MSKKEKQQIARYERKEFKNKLKIHCKVNRVSQRSLCDAIGITEQEFHNLLTGFQNSVPSKKIQSFEHFMQLILDQLCITSL